MKGNVGIRENGKLEVREVELPDFDWVSHSNRYIKLEDPPSDFRPDADGRLSFVPNDPRFACVHVLFHTHRALEYYLSCLQTLGSPLPREPLRLVVEVRDIAAGLTSARMHYKENYVLFWGSALFDETSIYHEVGHAVHGYLQPEACLRTEVDAAITAERNSRTAVQEAIADILAALFMRFPVVDHDQKNPRDLSKPVRKSEVKTIRDDFNSALADPEFHKAWPDNVVKIRKMLAGEHPVHAILDCPDPYAWSRVLSAPVWKAASRYGFERVQRVFLHTLKRVFPHSIPQAAEELLETCRLEGDNEVLEFLKTEFEATGTRA